MPASPTARLHDSSKLRVGWKLVVTLAIFARNGVPRLDTCSKSSDSSDGPRQEQLRPRGAPLERLEGAAGDGGTPWRGRWHGRGGGRGLGEEGGKSGWQLVTHEWEEAVSDRPVWCSTPRQRRARLPRLATARPSAAPSRLFPGTLASSRVRAASAHCMGTQRERGDRTRVESVHQQHAACSSFLSRQSAKTKTPRRRE